MFLVVINSCHTLSTYTTNGVVNSRLATNISLASNTVVIKNVLFLSPLSACVDVCAFLVFKGQVCPVLAALESYRPLIYGLTS